MPEEEDANAKQLREWAQQVTPLERNLTASVDSTEERLRAFL